MAYTLASVRNRVLDDKLDDTAFDGGIVDNFINDTQRSIFNTYEMPFAEKVFRGTLPVGGTIYDFPSDYQIEQALKITDPEGNIRDITENYMGFREFNRMFPVPSTRSAGQPTYWTTHAGKLLIDKPTDQQYTLDLYYLKKPDLLEDDADVPEVPSEWEECLVLGAYYRVLQRNEDFDLATAIKLEYQEQLDLMSGRLGRRQTGTPQKMRQPQRQGRVTRRRT